ncbi:MAG: hypothetical protein HYR73_09605 [Candidatus Eisenbacteria bacterium]|nr:hypothetical protein [Candidatus Eisenbacteria bacterium]
MTRLLPRFAVLFMLVSLFATDSWAAGPGINLSWTDCGSFGASNINNLCTSNGPAPTGTLITSFISPDSLPALLGCAGVIDITSSTGLMPSWWDLGPGGCRDGKISFSADFTLGPFSCVDVWAGLATGGLNYQYPFDSTNYQTLATALAVNHARVRTLQAVGTPVPVDSLTEYYAFKVTVSKALSTGGGSCAGCLIPMCLVFNSISLSQPAPTPDVILSTPIAAGSNQVTYQGAGADCNAVPVRQKTWGEIKSLYR